MSKQAVEAAIHAVEIAERMVSNASSHPGYNPDKMEALLKEFRQAKSWLKDQRAEMRPKSEILKAMEVSLPGMTLALVFASGLNAASGKAGAAIFTGAVAAAAQIWLISARCLHKLSGREFGLE